MYKIFNSLLLPVILLMFVSCGGVSLTGIWELEKVENGSSSDVVHRIEFFKDGTGIMDGVKIEWMTEKNRMMTSAFGQAQAENFKISGTTLTFISDDGIISIYKKAGSNKTPGVNINSDSESGQKSIRITGIDLKYRYFWTVYLYNTEDFDNEYINDGDISGSQYSENVSFEDGILTVPLGYYSSGEYNIWNGKGNYYIYLTLIPWEGWNWEEYISKKKISFNKKITEINFSDFNFVKSRMGQ